MDGAPIRYVHPAYFENAPRFHTGIGPGEMAAIIQPSESVLTPGQMRQLAPVANMQNGPTHVNVNVVVSPDNSVTQGVSSSAPAGAAQLGALVAAAVRSTIIDEKRPGGLLGPGS